MRGEKEEEGGGERERERERVTFLAKCLKSSAHVMRPYLHSDFLCWSKQVMTIRDN